MTPSFGARFEMLRQAVDAVSVMYAVTIYLPTQTLRCALQVDRSDGRCQIRSAPGADAYAAERDLPAWVHKHLLALARQLFREAQRDGEWLRRLMRWHEDPHATESRGQRLTGQSEARARSGALHDGDATATAGADEPA
ncbi:MAG: hypothetical protein JNJ46_14545 [Myxococcales bacterium]|nr:hypothetical protein [Myxococcales bacterium]